MIAGPTGIGKTDLAVELAHRLHGELISCDSVQVYRSLTIGANKTPTPVPQHMLDLVDWRQPFTAADFVQAASECIRQVLARGATPILVGGTGFYLDWVVEGRPGAPPTDPVILETIERQLINLSWEEAYNLLREVDPEYASVILPNDYYRLKRALVVHRQTGKPLSSFKEKSMADSTLASIEWRCFYLTHSNRLALLRHLDRRCELMVQRGLIREVLGLRKDGFSQLYQSGRAIGYKEALDLLDTIKTQPPPSVARADAALLRFLADFQSQTRQYTRKQEKWFASKAHFRWIERLSLEADLGEELIECVLNLFYASPEEWAASKRNSDDLLHRCRSEESMTERKRRLKTYSPELAIYGSSSARQSLLSHLDDPPSQEG